MRKTRFVQAYVGRSARSASRLLPVLAVSLLLVTLSSSAAPPAYAESTAPAYGLAPGEPSVLMINQELLDYPQASEQVGRQVEMLLRHFTPNTTMIDEAQYEDDQLFDFDRVVVIGNDATTPLPSVLLEDLARADRPVLWTGYGLEDLPVDTDVAFGFSLERIATEDVPNRVEYDGQDYPIGASSNYNGYKYDQVNMASSSSARVLATYGGGRSPVPYIVQSSNLWYVNGLPILSKDQPDPEIDGPPLIFADVLHDFFDTSVVESRQAVIRLEDVSVHIDPDSIIETTDYLYSQGVPFVLGLIPAQRFQDGSIVALEEKPEFVRALRYAQDHGGTVILHGYNHTFGSGEDYEFWDDVNDAPLAGEDWEMYADKVEDGIRILRDQGIEPRLWETPHYAGSPLAYEVFSSYFSHAIENRDPVEWLPYPGGPDEYGQVLIPENIGYINPEEGWTVDAQLERAQTLQIVRDGWAVGFYHPANIPLSELQSLVSGLQQQGYSFADLGNLPTEVRYDYQPDNTTQVATWLKVEPKLNLLRLDKGLERRLDWWPTMKRAPWLALLSTVLMAVFLVRLRKQWQPVKEVVERSLVETVSSTKTRRIPGPFLWLVAILVVAGVAAAASGVWLLWLGG